MHVALIVPDGSGIRNFVRDPFLEAWGGRCTVLHPPMDDAAWTTAVGELRSPPAQEEMSPLPDTPATFFLRHSLAYAHTHVADTVAMRYTRRRHLGGSWRTIAANRAARVVGKLAASQFGVGLLERLHHSSVERLETTADYRRTFERIRPDVVFAVCQKTPSILPAVLAARQLQIPTAGFIRSWDNISSKGRLAAPFDDYFVWSDHMRQELIGLYPNVSPDRCHVVGSPQFDPYGEAEHLLTKEEFFASIGADPSRPLICYSGGDDLTSPEDQDIVRILMEQVRDGRISSNVQVLVRPSPVDDGTRYERVRADFPEMLFEQPAWLKPANGNHAGYIPLPADSVFLANLTAHADLNINVASTMTVDFGLHDKPVVNVAFDIAKKPVRGQPLWELFYQWEHYRPVVELGAARCARSPLEMTNHVNAFLADPTLDRQGRKAFCDQLVGVPIGSASARVAKCLKLMVKSATVGEQAILAATSSQTQRTGLAGPR